MPRLPAPYPPPHGFDAACHKASASRNARGDAIEPVAQQLALADVRRLANQNQEGGLESVFGILGMMQRARHTPNTIGPCRAMSAAKANSSRWLTKRSSNWASETSEAAGCPPVAEQSADCRPFINRILPSTMSAKILHRKPVLVSLFLSIAVPLSPPRSEEYTAGQSRRLFQEWKAWPRTNRVRYCGSSTKKRRKPISAVCRRSISWKPPPKARQRKITLESLDLVHARRPDVQIFNELLVQYPRRGQRKLGQVVPDNMVVVWKEPIEANGSYDLPLQPVGPVLDAGVRLQAQQTQRLRRQHAEVRARVESPVLSAVLPGCPRCSGLEQLGHPALPVPASLRCAIPQVSRHSNLSHRTCSAEGPAGLVRDGLLAVGSSTAPLHMTRRLAICAMDSEWAAGTYSTFARRVVAGQTDHLECSKKTLVVVEEACFTRAAAKLHVAQPGVSAQIRRLERELGQELLDRSGRAVRPTEVGAAVLPYARAALSAVAGARLAVDELIGLVRGHVAVGTVTSHNVDLSALLAAFHEDHPAVEITLAEDNSDQLIDALRGARLDAAIIAMGATPPPDLRDPHRRGRVDRRGRQPARRPGEALDDPARLRRVAHRARPVHRESSSVHSVLMLAHRDGRLRCRTGP